MAPVATRATSRPRLRSQGRTRWLASTCPCPGPPRAGCAGPRAAGTPRSHPPPAESTSVGSVLRHARAEQLGQSRAPSHRAPVDDANHPNHSPTLHTTPQPPTHPAPNPRRHQHHQHNHAHHSNRSRPIYTPHRRTPHPPPPPPPPRTAARCPQSAALSPWLMTTNGQRPTPHTLSVREKSAVDAPGLAVTRGVGASNFQMIGRREAGLLHLLQGFKFIKRGGSV